MVEPRGPIGNQPPSGRYPRRPNPRGGRPPHQQAGMMPLPGGQTRGGRPMPPRGGPEQRTELLTHGGQPGQYGQPAPQGYPGEQPPGPPPPRPKKKKRRFGPGKVLGILGLVLVLFIAGIWLYLEFSINRVEAISDYEGRPAAGAGTNWLIVGADSREGLSKEEINRLHVGDPTSNATDTILLAHLPDGDTKPTLVSFPRDLNVEIPGHGVGKINSAYARGGEQGPQTLVRTVEHLTGLRVDHYAEINFVGFANIVDAIGGVEMDVPEGMVDGSNGQELKPGKQTLDGAQALTFVRMRKSAATPRSDLDRVANQRKFIGALAGEISSAGTILNPLDLFPLVGEIPGALTLDEGDHLHNLLFLGLAAQGISDGGMLTITAPVTDGSATALDQAKADALFNALRNDTKVPDSVIQAGK